MNIDNPPDPRAFVAVRPRSKTEPLLTRCGSRNQAQSPVNRHKPSPHSRHTLSRVVPPSKHALSPNVKPALTRPKNQKRPQNQSLILLQQNQQTMISVLKSNVHSVQLCVLCD